jgi:hypothetical protein
MAWTLTERDMPLKTQKTRLPMDDRRVGMFD